MAKKIQKKSKRLHLIHRKHTAKLLHRRHTSYPLLAFLLLSIGVLLTAMTLQAKAATVTVTGVNLGDPPTTPAVITSPIDGDRFTDDSIVVSGTCPGGFYVKLLRNNVFSGSVLCAVDDTFTISTSLFAGRNDLEARIYNIANNEGPRSGEITVYYDTPDEEPTPTEPSGSVFYLATEYFYKAAYTGQEISWDFDIFGGKAPFDATVSWGDGTTSTHSANGRKLTIKHTYNSLDDERQHFVIKITLKDANSKATSLQLIAIMNEPNMIGGALAQPQTPSPGSAASNSLLRYVWSAYALVVLMGISFWLGERRGEALGWNKLRLKTR